MPNPILCVRGLRGSIEGKSWRSDRRLRVGRVKYLEIVLDDSGVSRQHAEFVWTPHGWCLRDLESTNGSHLNGMRVGRAETKIRKGDIVQFGDSSLVVESIGKAEIAPASSPDKRVEILHTSSHSWEQLPVALASVAGSGRMDLLNALATIGRDFHGHRDLKTYLRTALWDIVTVLECRLGSISMIDEFSDMLQLRTVFNMGASSNHEGWPVPELAEWVRGRSESIICEHRGADGSQPHSEMFVTIRSPRKILGVLQLVRSAEHTPFDETELMFAEALCLSMSMTIESLDHQLKKEADVMVSMLTVLTQLAHLRDDWTLGQNRYATDYALMLAERLQLSETERHCLRIGTPLRDLGRLAIPDRVLNKPGQLTPDEMHLVKMHVSKGVALLEHVPSLVPVIPIVQSHHERWDGKGYPDGLSGEQIPILARIVAVADAFEALTTSRPYRKALRAGEALMEIQAQAGAQFDPACVNALFACRNEIETFLGEHGQLGDTIVSDALSQTQPLSKSGHAPGRSADSQYHPGEASGVSRSDLALIRQHEHLPVLT